MKKAIFALAVMAIVSCNASRNIDRQMTSKNNDNIFVNVKKVKCKMDIEKRIGRQLSVQ